MIGDMLARLQQTIQHTTEFSLKDYYDITLDFLHFVGNAHLIRIVSPSRQNSHYIFFQYGSSYHHKITRPLNTRLFIESSVQFELIFTRFIAFLSDLKKFQDAVVHQKHCQSFIATNELNKVIYTMQQAIGCVGDSFDNANQSRKRIGQLFEILIKLIIQEVGLVCEPRTVNIPIPGYSGYNMSYELDVVFSRDKAILTAESKYIHLSEIVGSIKTTSKDRIDKIFLDKYLLTKLLGAIHTLTIPGAR